MVQDRGSDYAWTPNLVDAEVCPGARGNPGRRRPVYVGSSQVQTEVAHLRGVVSLRCAVRAFNLAGTYARYSLPSHNKQP